MPTPDATSGAPDSRDLDAKSKPWGKANPQPLPCNSPVVGSFSAVSVRDQRGHHDAYCFYAVGTSLSNQIATSLFENKKNQALEESIKGIRQCSERF